MKITKIIETLALGAMVLALGSCDRADVPVEEPGDVIRISASGSEVQTRGLLNASDLGTAGTEVKVYDWLTGFTGKIGTDSYTNGSVMYIDDAVECTTAGNPGTWAFKTAPWRWTRTGVHHFFGWLQKDASETDALTSPLGETFDASTRELTIPAYKFDTLAAHQFDFSYSNVVTKSTAEDVEIPLKHLFTAMQVNVKNYITTDLTDIAISFDGIVDSTSATIDFTAESTVYAVYAGGTKQKGFQLAGQETATAPAASTETDAQIDSVVIYPGSLLWRQPDMSKVKVTVSFKMGDNTNTLSATLGSDLFPVVEDTATGYEYAMHPGKKYILTIIINPTQIDFEVVVDPLTEYYYKMDDNHDDYLIKP